MVSCIRDGNTEAAKVFEVAEGQVMRRELVWYLQNV